MKRGKLRSDILNKEFDYYILASEQPTDNAFVLYVQDGKDYLELGSAEKAYQELLRKYPEKARQLVMIFIHPGDSMERWHSYHHNGDYFSKYIQFINDEFISKVEKDLTVNIRKRGLLGDSLAGNVSLNIACVNPEQWTHLLLQSAAVAPEDITFLAGDVTGGVPWQVYQTVGIHEDQYVSQITNENLYLLSRNRALYQTFVEKGANVSYREQNEKHEWVFWKRDLQDALAFFLNQ